MPGAGRCGDRVIAPGETKAPPILAAVPGAFNFSPNFAMSRQRLSRGPKTHRYRVHFRELGYYQSVVEAANPQQAIKLVQESPPDLTFIATEEREVIGIDQRRKNKTWQQLSDEIVADMDFSPEMTTQPDTTDPAFALYVVSTADAQYVAESMLGRELTAVELAIIHQKIHFDWCEQLKLLIDDHIRPGPSTVSQREP